MTKPHQEREERSLIIQSRLREFQTLREEINHNPIIATVLESYLYGKISTREDCLIEMVKALCKAQELWRQSVMDAVHSKKLRVIEDAQK